MAHLPIGCMGRNWICDAFKHNKLYLLHLPTLETLVSLYQYCGHIDQWIYVHIPVGMLASTETQMLPFSCLPFECYYMQIFHQIKLWQWTEQHPH